MENSVLNNLLYRILAFTHLEINQIRSPENQPDELDDILIENNHEECSYSQKIKSMISGQTM